MIIDITGVELTPGFNGEDCLGNGLHYGIECCCDECNYMICCLETWSPEMCKECCDKDCPKSPFNKDEIF